ncbi:MAG: hypothetical protein EA412_08255 [Chitinophagaceae bacterium]|nr:MAG: hypothetical protein EA412_08255 [Chitinophagaceae bacterium]
MLRERWHFLGHPIFRLADRNFNVWWTDFNRSFSRTIYGLSFTHFNMRGRNEKLHINGHLGFNRKLELSYTIPGFGKKRNFGAFVNASWQSNREVFTSAENHKQIFHRLPEYAINFIQTDLFLTYRAAHISEFGAGISYNDNQVTDTIVKLNDNFLETGKNRQRFLSASLYYRNDKRDRKIYATEGSMWEVRLKQSGLGLMSETFMTELFGVYSQFLNLGSGFYISTQLRTKFSLPREQPYLNQSSLGFLKDLVRGYEFYVIDGRHHGVFKFNFKKNIFNYNLNDGWIPGLDKLQRLPVNVYLKAFFDAGYVYDDYFYTGDFLINKPLWSAGLGLDIVTAYDFVWRVEYAVNHLGENGLYLHFLTDL